VQPTPQAVQLVAVPSGVSQPAALVQSANPEEQAPWLQLTVEPASVQVAAAFGKEHGVPQLPQSVSVTTLRSQPLSGLLSQLLKPGLQTGVQAAGLPVQLVVPFCAVQA